MKICARKRGCLHKSADSLESFKIFFKNLKNIKKISRAMDGIIRRRNLTKSIGRKDKWDSCVFCCIEITKGIPHIYGGFKLIVLNDLADIIGFGISGVSRTKMAFKVRTKTTGFQKDFDITGLAVTYNEQSIYSGAHCASRALCSS